jgi:hypothetical protein
MIVPQKSTQPVATSHWLVVVCFADPMEQQQVVLTLVISLCMIVRDIVLHLSERSPKGMIFDKHSSLTDRTQRSAWAFKFGLRAGKRTVSM